MRAIITVTPGDEGLMLVAETERDKRFLRETWLRGLRVASYQQTPKKPFTLELDLKPVREEEEI